MTNTLPKISEAAIKELSNGQSFDRGKSYYRGEAIREPMQQGNTLRGYCEGSGYQPYRVTAELNQHGIESVHCTCPYDWGGICKHSVALLLTWIHEPERFNAIPPLDTSLAGRSKEELILLIKEMLKREPDLARLLELPVQPDRNTPLDLAAFRRQISYALNQGGDYDDYYYEGAAAVAGELSSLVDTADRFRKEGDWINAGDLYALILEEVVPGYEELYDENGDVSIELQRCAEALEECFMEGNPDTDARRTWLTALLEADIKDTEMGGMDLAPPAGEVVIEQATDEEWIWIEARVQQAIAARTDRYSSWGREALVGFLAQRLAKTGQSEQVDELIFQTGSPQQQAFLLIERSRFEEAINIAQQHFAELPGLVTQFADALLAAGAAAEAEAYVSSLSKTRRGGHYRTWLANYAEQSGRLSTALDLWLQEMLDSPSVQSYNKIQELAQSLDRWPDTRQVILQTLEDKEVWHILLEIALEEEDVAWALRLLPKLKGWYTPTYRLRVAQAAETNQPEAALKIYDEHVHDLIKARGRGNYQEAAHYLTRMKDIHIDQGHQQDWPAYIDHIRREYANLPALRDELNQAGL